MFHPEVGHGSPVPIRDCCQVDRFLCFPMERQMAQDVVVSTYIFSSVRVKVPEILPSQSDQHIKTVQGKSAC